MKITRHIHYFQNPTTCLKHEFTFDPPIDLPSTLGKIDEIFKDFDLKRKLKLEEVAPVINGSNILDIRNLVMNAGESLSIEAPIGYRLADVIKDDSCQMQILVNAETIIYWFTIGKTGAVGITGQLIKDDDSFHRKLKANLADIPFREYLVRRTLADVDMEKVTPEIMSHSEAATYLKISPKTLYNKRDVPRLKGNLYGKSELDMYLKRKK